MDLHVIKIFHETPNSIFNEMQQYTDGDYALVHFLENNVEYRELFYEAVSDGREVILDNSVIELGEAFSSEGFAKWVEKLSPTWYIVPDTLGEYEKTVNRSFEFINEYSSNLPGKIIAVAQGESLSTLIRCFEEFHEDDRVDMIALPFRPKYFEEIAEKLLGQGKEIEAANLPPAIINPPSKWGIGRNATISVLDAYYRAGIFHKPVHLLGCGLPQEGKYYSNIDWIYSTDTSNPIIAGMEGTIYSNDGLIDKSTTSIDDIINSDVSSEQLSHIIYNTKKFRSFWAR